MSGTVCLLDWIGESWNELRKVAFDVSASFRHPPSASDPEHLGHAAPGLKGDTDGFIAFKDPFCPVLLYLLFFTAS